MGLQERKTKKIHVELQVPSSRSPRTAFIHSISVKCHGMGVTFAQNLSHKFCLKMSQHFPARCQVGELGSCVATMAALAARLFRRLRTCLFRAPYAALRFSSVWNVTHSCFGGLCRASPLRIPAVALCCGTASNTYTSLSLLILYC